MFHTPGGQGDFGLTPADNTSSDSESEDKDETRRVTFKLDDWLSYKVDSEVNSLVPVKSKKRTI